MAGILNSKSRVVDTIITLEGRRQLSAGDFQIKYASFTDGSTFYESDVVSGSSDAGARIFFEANSMHYDAIAFEADDSGKLVPAPGLFKDGIGAVNGKIVSSSASSKLEFVTGSQFASLASKLFASSLDNFKRLRVISSAGPFEDESEFRLNTNKITFTITDNIPIPETGKLQEKTIDEIGDLFSDPRCSHVPNFWYLPPVNSPLVGETRGSLLGDYPPLGPRDEMQPEELLNEIKKSEEKGCAFDIEFERSSLSNNIFAQFFEINGTDVKKLDIIDYGSFTPAGSLSSMRAFFVGKVYVNSYGVHTFVNMFTLVFYDNDVDKVAF